MLGIRSVGTAGRRITQGKRTFYNLTGKWHTPQISYTKYRISHPLVQGQVQDDLYLADPTRDDFAKMTKESPLFLRFLKIVCQVESRPADFVQFAKRCESGLVVEKDVFITKEELCKNMWQNGFSEAEQNAFQIAFPDDYHFHYPELAVLFSLEEDACYQFCLRTRAANPEHLVTLNFKKPPNLLSSYGLLFLGVWYGFSNQVLSNAWFYSKTFPFGAVFFMLSSYFQREIKEFMSKTTREANESSLEMKREFEELLYGQIKKYAHDTHALDYLKSFKGTVQSDLAKYSAALVDHQKYAATNKIIQKLTAVAQAEKATQSSLQQVVASEVVADVKEALGRDGALEDASLSAAVRLLAGEQLNAEKGGASLDPVGLHCSKALQMVQKPTENKDREIVRKIQNVFDKKQTQFLQQFTVLESEAAEVKDLAKKCKKGENELNFDLLSQQETARFEELYQTLTTRMGYEVPHENEFCSIEADPSSQHFIDAVSQKVAAAAKEIRHARLSAFAAAF